MAARAQALRAELDLEALLVTRSEEGMSLYTDAKARRTFPAQAREVFDVSGAGDTVIATLGTLLGAGAPLEVAVRDRQSGGRGRGRQARGRRGACPKSWRDRTGPLALTRPGRWPRQRRVYSCTECGGQSPKWQGQCPHCGAWNTLVETAAAPRADALPRGRRAARAPCAPLGSVDARDAPRFPTGIEEFDRVLGGGLVPGGVVLLGGDPGIGKSTLAACRQRPPSALRSARFTSPGRNRWSRWRCVRSGWGWSMRRSALLAEVQLEAIVATIDAEAARGRGHRFDPDHVYRGAHSAPGSVAQVRECAAQLTRLAKQRGVMVILVGHVTKEGAIAGPRVLEHIVDTVLYFEGDTHSSFRLVRAIKNRFGAANELGVFAMTERGLKGVANPSAMFLSQHAEAVPGICDRRHHGGLATAAGGNPGAGRSRPGRYGPPAFGRAGPAAAGAAARRPASPRWRRNSGLTMSSSMPSEACASASPPPILRSCWRCIPRFAAARCRPRRWCSAR